MLLIIILKIRKPIIFYTIIATPTLRNSSFSKRNFLRNMSSAEGNMQLSSSSSSSLCCLEKTEIQGIYQIIVLLCCKIPNSRPGGIIVDLVGISVDHAPQISPSI